MNTCDSPNRLQWIGILHRNSHNDSDAVFKSNITNSIFHELKYFLNAEDTETRPQPRAGRTDSLAPNIRTVILGSDGKG